MKPNKKNWLTRDFTKPEKERNGVKIVIAPEVIADGIDHQAKAQRLGEDGLRYFSGGARRIEDYTISRAMGDKPVIIREVPSEAQGLKKYMLLYSFDTTPDKTNSRTIYSEGIDVQKMISNQEYSMMVREYLLSEDNLRKKTQIAGENGFEGAYVGFVGQLKDEYRKIAASDKTAVYKTIAKGQQQKKDEEKQQENARRERSAKTAKVASKYKNMPTEDLEVIQRAIDDILAARENSRE